MMTSGVEALVAELEQEAATTQRVLARVPNDQLGWKPHPKSMSLGQLAQHVASSPGDVAQLLSNDGLEISPAGMTPPALTSAAELVPLLERSVRAAKAFLSALDEQRAMATWRVTKEGKEVFAAPRIAAARAILLNHWYHHRGQLSVYLRLLDVPIPSIYGPSADEDPFAAA
jgi:uncharacterized damage-inducible protein DinB